MDGKSPSDCLAKSPWYKQITHLPTQGLYQTPFNIKMFSQGKERQRSVSATNFGYSRQVWGLCYPNSYLLSCWNGLGWTEVGHLELLCEFRQNHCRFYLQGVTERYTGHLAPWKIQGEALPLQTPTDTGWWGVDVGQSAGSWEQRWGKRAQ